MAKGVSTGDPRALVWGDNNTCPRNPRLSLGCGQEAVLPGLWLCQWLEAGHLAPSAALASTLISEYPGY